MKLHYSSLFLSIALWVLLACYGCSSRNMVKMKNIPYINSKDFHKKKHCLDVYYKNDGKEDKGVFVFIHGGGWRLGDKRTYRYFGKRMAEKGKVAVLVNYRVGKRWSYKNMAADCAAALKWVSQGIHSFAGDTSRIFVSGHSAGGHLAALITLDSSWFRKEGIPNPVKGAILIDPFGLDMYSFFTDSSYRKVNHVFYPIFSRDTAEWRAGSPISYIRRGQPPVYVTAGSKTVKSIRKTSKAFASAYAAAGNKTIYSIVKGREHIGMIFQFYDRDNPLYAEILKFMEEE